MLLLIIIISCRFALGIIELSDLHNDQIARERQARFTENIMKLYEGFSIMFHLENLTYYSIDYLLKLTHDSNFGEVIIINQDMPLELDFEQRKGSPFLHLVILNNLRKYQNFLDYPGCLIARDTVMFIIYRNTNWDQDQFWTMPHLDWAGNVIILNTSNTFMSLYNVCYYCGRLSKKLNHLQTSNTSVLRINQLELLPRNFTNFNGHHFEVGYINVFPFVWCESSNDTQINMDVFRRCVQPSGIEIGLLNVLSEKLNFTYWLIEHDYALRYTHNDINRVSFRRLDFVVGGLPITAARAPQKSFTTTLEFEPYTFLYVPRKSLVSDLFGILEPFLGTLWLTVTLTTWGFSLFLYICMKIVSDNVRDRNFPFLKCLKVCFKAIVEQTENVRLSYFRTHFTPYLILILWWFSAVIMATAYKSKLWAISIKNYHVEPANLQELLDNGYDIVVNTRNLGILEDVLTDADPLMDELKRNLVLKDRTCATLSYALNNKAAMLDEHATIQFHALTRCTDVLNDEVYPKLRFTKTPLRSITHSWLLQIGAPYKYIFDFFIERMHAGGFKVKWKTDTVGILRSRYNSIPYSQTTTMEIGDKREFLRGFLSPFFFYILGNVVSLICFVAELLYARMIPKY